MFAWVEGIVGVGLFEDGVGADPGYVGTAPFGGVERGFGPALAHVVTDSALGGGSCSGEIGGGERDKPGVEVHEFHGFADGGDVGKGGSFAGFE